MRKHALLLYTIYEHPTDYPDGYVVRRWLVEAGAPPTPLGAHRAPTLDAVRALLPPGLARLPRELEDDPVIVETWL